MNLVAKHSLPGKTRKIPLHRLMLFFYTLPFVALIFAFNYIPLFGWVYALFDYKPGIPLAETPFAGAKYFLLMLQDRTDLYRVIVNTLAFSFLGILFSPLPVITAILLNEIRSKAFRRFVQTTTTLPHFVSWVIVFSLAFSMFSSGGLVNKLMQEWGWIGHPLNVLGNGEHVWIIQALFGIWKSLGWSAIIYLAAIAGIDSELYDAARVDGAGQFRVIAHITIPGLIPTYIVLLVLSISNMLSVGFEQYFVFYNPLVANKIEVLDYFVYRVGIAGNDYPYATAVGICKSVISITLLFTANWIAKRLRGESIV